MDKVDDLPDSKDKFWKDAEMEKIPPHEPISCALGSHKFIQYEQEARCGCGVGYQMGQGSFVEQGHIYLYGKLLV